MIEKVFYQLLTIRHLVFDKSFDLYELKISTIEIVFGANVEGVLQS